jgi:hypothetical protein
MPGREYIVIRAIRLYQWCLKGGITLHTNKLRLAGDLHLLKGVKSRRTTGSNGDKESKLVEWLLNNQTWRHLAVSTVCQNLSGLLERQPPGHVNR